MTQNEISEIRRRYRADRSNISRVCGCFVNEQKEIISEFDQSLGTMTQDDAEGMLDILKKVLSGNMGRNLLDIEFTTAQVNESEEYRLISELRGSELKNETLRQELYKKIIDNLEMEGNYLILMAHDRQDVFDYGVDGERDSESVSVFSYIICAVCPIKEGKPTMSYYIPGKCFRSVCSDTVLGRAELGFMFPCLEDNKTNIYKALYYTKSLEDSHQELADALFSNELPMPAKEQKDTFGDILKETVAEECSLRVVRSVNSQLNHRISEHKNEKIEEPLLINKSEAGDMLRYCGVTEEKIEAFEEKFDERFGEDATIPPSNISSPKQITVSTPEVTVKVSADSADMVEARIIDGTKYILIRADNGVTVNGVEIEI